MGNKKKSLNSEDLKPVMLRIQPSLKYKGVGVFAVRNMRKGTIVCNAEKIDEEVFFSWEYFNGLDETTQRSVIDFCAQDKDGFYSPVDLNYLPIPIHMNHSCHGNVGCDREDNFVAIEDIEKGQELCFDYALVISNPRYKLKCTCGYKQCRKVITGNDWMDAEFQKQNYQYMSTLLRKLVAEHSSFPEYLTGDPGQRSRRSQIH